MLAPSRLSIKIGGKSMFNELKAMMKKPAFYEKGTAELWTDEHI